MNKKELIENVIATGSNHFTRAEVISYIENIETDEIIQVNKFDLEKMFEKIKCDTTTVCALITIGKSKELIAYIFPKKDFVRCEGFSPFVKDEERRLRFTSMDDMKEFLININGLK